MSGVADTMPFMPEFTDRDRELLTRLEAKLDVLAAAIGGPNLKARWDEIERQDGIPSRRRTFRRARCGCFKGSQHEEGCKRHDGANARLVA